jgi:hypothetical protein
VGDEICGAVVSIRQNEDILSIWNKTASDGRTNMRIRSMILIQGYDEKSLVVASKLCDRVQGTSSRDCGQFEF